MLSVAANAGAAAQRRGLAAEAGHARRRSIHGDAGDVAAPLPVRCWHRPQNSPPGAKSGITTLLHSCAACELARTACLQRALLLHDSVWLRRPMVTTLVLLVGPGRTSRARKALTRLKPCAGCLGTR